MASLGYWLRKKAQSLSRIRRFGQSRQIEVLDQIRLSPQHSVHVVRIRGRDMAIACHPQGVTPLGAVEEQAGTTPEGSPATGLAALFQRPLRGETAPREQAPKEVV
ncbi:MAG: flagellar biosynthetic protein FliO [Acidobacteria bacterium]|nr:flagellar biosynthetic protein FliO [Acidobacteriota bacterium]